jgi:RNA polymerase sigma-70 factor (ECF subfamily)
MQHVRRLCPEPARQEDLVQTALLQALEHLPDLRRPERLAAWVRRIITNLFLMEQRSRRLEGADTKGMPETQRQAVGCEAGIDARRELERVARLVPCLPPLLAETFRFRVIEGLSTREAARRLGVSEEAVRARLARARKLLRSYAI